MKAGITLEFKEIVNRVSNHMIANMDKMRINRLKDGVAPGAGVKWTAARTLDWDLIWDTCIRGKWSMRSHTSFATYTRVNFHFSIIQSLYYSYLNMSFIFPSIYQRVFRFVLLHKVYKKNKYNVQNYVSRVYLLIHTLASILNFNAIKILEFMYLWLFRFYRFSAILVKILIHKLNLVNL